MKNIFTYDATGRITRPVLESLAGHAKAIDAVNAKKATLEEVAVENYTLLRKAKIAPLDLKSPVKPSKGTCTQAEYNCLVIANAERIWGKKSSKFKLVWRYLFDRDNMTGAEKKIGKANAKSAKTSLSIISDNYAKWINGGCKEAGQVKDPAPRKTDDPDVFMAKRLNAVQAKAEKSVDAIRTKYPEYDQAVFAQLIAPAIQYIEQLGKAKPESKQVSFDAKGNRRAKK